MIPTPRTQYELLSRTDGARVDAACDRFEKAWKSVALGGARPAIPEACADFVDPARTVLIWELIALDRDYRTERGEMPRPEDYRGLCAEYDGQLPADTPTQFMAGANRVERVGPWPELSGFKIVEVLGTGGMGVVYKAWQPALDRYVAVKMLRSAAIAEPGQRERFDREARAVAQLHHPNLVQIYAVGEAPAVGGAELSPYFVMEYVNGGTLAQHIRGTPQRPRDAAQLVLTIARAMHHVHSQGIVHRDLKPGNVLMQARNDGPADRASSTTVAPSIVLQGSFFLPKVTDFGLAKLGGDDLTKTGDALGTPSYMAPEQTDSRSTIGPAADIYGLGAILYETLAGRPPFQAETPVATVMQVRQDEPVSPRRLQPTVPRDLETICLKCLRKDPHHRYATADALADDLSRFLAGETIHARPVTSLERATKWARRRPVVAALSILVVLLTVGGIAGVVTQWLRATRLLDDVKKAQAKEAEALGRHRVIRAYDEWMADNAQAARDLLRDAPDRAGTWEARYVNRLCNLGRHTFADHQNDITGIAFTPDGNTLITADRDGAIFVRGLADRKTERFTLSPDRTDDIASISLNPVSGQHLAVATARGTVYIWNLHTKTVVATWQAFDPGRQIWVAYSSDGCFVAASLGNTAKIWDVARQREVHSLSSPSALQQVAWSPDGRYLAGCGNTRHQVRIWEAVSGKWKTTLPTITWQPTAVAFSPDNRRFAWSGMDSVVAIHNTSAFQRTTTLPGLPGFHACLTFSPDGRFVAAGSLNGPAKIWNVETSQLVATLHGHSSGVRGLAFSPDGTQLATFGSDRRVTVWDVTDYQEVSTFPNFTPGRLYAVAFSPDGKLMATGIRDFRLWDVERRSQKFRFPPEGELKGICLAFHPSGAQIAGGDEHGTVHIFDTSGRELASHAKKGIPIALTYVNEGLEVLIVGWGNALYRWNPTSKAPPTAVIPALGDEEIRIGRRAAFSPDGQRLAFVERGQALGIWDLQTITKSRTFDETPPIVTVVTFDRSGRRLALGTGKGEIQIRDTDTGQIAATLVGHPLDVIGLAFTPDGARLASTARDGCVKLWDLVTAQEVLSIRGHATFDTAIGFSPDGENCVVGGLDGYLRMWSIHEPSTDRDDVWRDRRQTWHEQVAYHQMRAKQWFAARHHYRQLLALDSNKWEYHRQCGRASAELGEWPVAAAAYDAAMAHADCDLRGFAEGIAVDLKTGNREAYRKHCRMMLDRFGQSETVGTINNVVWMCVIPREPPISGAKLVDLCERALVRATARDKELLLNTVGATMYRAGRADDAIKFLEDSVNQSGKGNLEDWLFLALAHHSRGSKDQAAEWYNRAAEEYAKVARGSQLPDGPSVQWWRRIELDALFQEAKAALGK